MSVVLPIEDSIREDYLRGATLAQLSQIYGKPRFELTTILSHPSVTPHTLSRMQSLRLRAIEFKLRAFDAAEDALEDLDKLGKATVDEHLKRKIDNDLIRIAGLEPRKVVQINQHTGFSIDEETRNWFDGVLAESGIVDAEP